MTSRRGIPLERAFNRPRYLTPGMGAGQDLTTPLDRERPGSATPSRSRACNRHLTVVEIAEVFGEDQMTDEELNQLHGRRAA